MIYENAEIHSTPIVQREYVSMPQNHEQV